MSIGSEPIGIQVEVEDSDHTDEAREHLVAAGEAVRNWAYARRSTWTDRPLHTRPATPKLDQRQPSQGGPRPSVSNEPRRPVEFAPEDIQPAPAAPKLAPFQESEGGPPPKQALKITVPESSVRWASRMAVAAVLVAVVGAAVWMTRDRWEGWSDAVNSMRSSPEPAPSRSEPPAENQPANPAPAAAATPSGRLEVRSNPEGARVIVDDQFRGVAPLTVDDLAAGPHTVVLQSGGGTVERRVQVAAGDTTVVEEAIFSGWLNVYSTIELEISEGTRAIRLNDESAALMPPGAHKLTFANRELGYSATRDVVIKPGETTAISIVPAKSSLTVTANSPAEVFIDGERGGEVPLNDYQINLGTHEIRVRTPTGVERRFTITVGAKPSRLDVDFSKP